MTETLAEMQAALAVHYGQVEAQMRHRVRVYVAPDGQEAAQQQVSAAMADLRARPVYTKDQARTIMSQRGFLYALTAAGGCYPLADWNPYDADDALFCLDPDNPGAVFDAHITVGADAAGLPLIYQSRWRFLTLRDLCALCGQPLTPQDRWQVRGLEAALGPFCSHACAADAAVRAGQGRGGSRRPHPVYREETDAETQARAGLGGL